MLASGASAKTVGVRTGRIRVRTRAVQADSLVQQHLGQQTQGTAEPRTIFDLGDSGGSDIVREKDRYVAGTIRALR
jgi:hypothetical protein